MPCNDGGWEWDARNPRSADIARLQSRNDELARENCLLRETLIKIFEAKAGSAVEVDPKVMKLVKKSQLEHRKDDLKRIEKALRAKIAEQPDVGMHPLCNYYEMLGRVMVADAKQPLEPQLGFDPDEI